MNLFKNLQFYFFLIDPWNKMFYLHYYGQVFIQNSMLEFCLRFYCFFYPQILLHYIVFLIFIFYIDFKVNFIFLEIDPFPYSFFELFCEVQWYLDWVLFIYNLNKILIKNWFFKLILFLYKVVWKIHWYHHNINNLYII